MLRLPQTVARVAFVGNDDDRPQIVPCGIATWRGSVRGPWQVVKTIRACSHYENREKGKLRAIELPSPPPLCLLHFQWEGVAVRPAAPSHAVTGVKSQSLLKNREAAEPCTIHAAQRAEDERWLLSIRGTRRTLGDPSRTRGCIQLARKESPFTYAETIRASASCTHRSGNSRRQDSGAGGIALPPVL